MPSTLPRPHHLHAQSLLCSESVVLRGGAVFLESPQLGLQSSLLCTCPRREAWPGRGLGAALLPAGGALMVLGAGGAPGSTPSTPPAILRGRTASSQAPWSSRKAGYLVGREDCVPHNLPQGALPQAVALVPIIPPPPPSPLRPWPTGWSARVRTSPGYPRPRPSPHPPALL